VTSNSASGGRLILRFTRRKLSPSPFWAAQTIPETSPSPLAARWRVPHRHQPGIAAAEKCPAASKRFGTNPRKIKRKIQGWIVQPAQFRSRKKNIRSSSKFMADLFADYGDRFDYRKASLGSARLRRAFTPNPRGSTSYGEEFANPHPSRRIPATTSTISNSGVDAVVAQRLRR